MKKIINFIKQKKYTIQSSYLYIYRLNRLVFKSFKNIYKFSLKERYKSAKNCINGYKKTTPELYNKTGDNVTVGHLNICVPQNTFKPGELAYIYDEVFTPIKNNPHAYETDFIKIQPGDIVIDAGACEGFFTFYALEKKAQKVYAFEPLEILNESLHKTFSAQIHTNNVILQQKGLSDKTGSTKFNTGDNYVCTAQFDEYGSETIQTITLDDFVLQNNMTSINFIKMDIENAEVQAIQGAQETIKKFKPKLSIAVYHNYENAKKIKAIILRYTPDYTIVFGGCSMHETPYRPFMLYAYVR